MEDREASRQERQAHLAVLQQLAANAQNNNHNNNGNGNGDGHLQSTLSEIGRAHV